ncbi:hypothetical protein CYY_006862 [Polysphondylium violaceum]|uniref:WD40 repeat-containing protein n=1 Tax=Polysphondylium violaceum TaxID=133409 RepID=A0A8J4PRU0_9MYCE|nr:hypothetical protein CYY_006862 [Polysphondylium violaceum]
MSLVPDQSYESTDNNEIEHKHEVIGDVNVNQSKRNVDDGDGDGSVSVNQAGQHESVIDQVKSKLKVSNHVEMLPCSSNWYSCMISDYNHNDIYIYASKSIIILFNIKTRKFIGELIGHSDRLTSLCFNKFNNQQCISGSCDKSVRLWDIDSCKCIAFHQELHRQPVTFVATSPLVLNLIASADKEGKIVLWRTLNNHTDIIAPIANTEVTFMCFSPNHADLVAIGYVNGVLVIYNLISKSIVTKISAHQQDVLSIVWFDNRVTKNMISGGSFDTLEYIATSSKDKTIKIWKQIDTNTIDKGFSNLAQLNPIKFSSMVNEKSANQQRSWVTLSWSSTHNPQYLVSSSATYDILLWNLQDLKAKPEKLKGGHSRTVFNITQANDPAPKHNNPKANNKYNNRLITISLDRNMIVWENCKAAFKIPGLGGFVYSLDSSPFNPNTLAIGCGDNSIHLWNPMENTDNPYECKSVWKGILSKVTALSICRHVIDGSLIAFGMDDGRVGVYNGNSNQVTMFPSGHKSEIYEVAWKPAKISQDRTKESKLYSVGNNEIYEWDLDNLDKGYLPLSHYVKSGFSGKQKSDIAWSEDGERVAISYSDGTIDIFNKHWEFVAKTKSHSKLVNRLKWNPHNSTLLASGSVDKKVIIYKLSPVAANQNNDGEKENVNSNFEIQVLSTFTGHRGSICGLCWSTSDKNLIASASGDGSVRVWNIETNECLAVIRGHDGRVFTVFWSLLDPTILFSGGEDQTVRMWDYTNPVFKPSIAESNTITPKMAPFNNIVKDSNDTIKPIELQSNTSPNSTSTPNSTPSSTSSSPPPSTSTTTTTINTPSQAPPKKKIIIPLTKDIIQKPDVKSQLLPLTKYYLGKLSSNSNDQYKDFIVDYGNTANNDNETIPSIESIFLDKCDVVKEQIEKESLELLKIDDIDNYLSIHMWNGNIKKALYYIIKHGKLTPNAVSLSMQAGKEIHETVCYLYSQQLVCVGDFHMAVSYLLLIGKVDEAIQVYRKSSHLHEAILLAKSRYPLDHPVVLDLLVEWSDLTSESNPLHSIKCLLSCLNKENKDKLFPEILHLLKSIKSSAKISEIQSLIENSI